MEYVKLIAVVILYIIAIVAGLWTILVHLVNNAKGIGSFKYDYDLICKSLAVIVTCAILIVSLS